MDMDMEDGGTQSRTKQTNCELEEGEDLYAERNIEELEGDVVPQTDSNTGLLKDGEVLEPYVGMEFESENAARNFYTEYARKSGFVVRIMQRRRSEIDGRTLARRLGCNKQGFSPNHKGTIGSDKRARPSAREGCKATILVKMEKSGKWVVTRFVKDHNHPLAIPTTAHSNGGDKDRKIEELTLELQRQDQLCAAYRQKLLNFLATIEEQGEQLSSKIQGVVENVRKAEAEIQKSSHNEYIRIQRRPWLGLAHTLSDTGALPVDSSTERESFACEESSVREPFVGMEFGSEDAAKEFYDEYARAAGFIMRIDQCRRSEVDKRILSRRLSCNKQGYYVKTKDQNGSVRKQRTSTREGCKAMMLVKVNKSGKWVVTRFVKDHSHPLIVSGRSSRNAMDFKDRKIQELTAELERQDKLCDLYREQINSFLKSIEEETQLVSTKVRAAVNNVREFETENQQQSNH